MSSCCGTGRTSSQCCHVKGNRPSRFTPTENIHYIESLQIQLIGFLLSQERQTTLAFQDYLEFFVFLNTTVF